MTGKWNCTGNAKKPSTRATQQWKTPSIRDKVWHILVSVAALLPIFYKASAQPSRCQPPYAWLRRRGSRTQRTEEPTHYCAHSRRLLTLSGQSGRGHQPEVRDSNRAQVGRMVFPSWFLKFEHSLVVDQIGIYTRKNDCQIQAKCTSLHAGRHRLL